MEPLAQGTRSIKDKSLGARAQFLLGQLFESLGQYDAAIDAYNQVRRFNPVYELSYAAKYKAIEVEVAYGNPNEALKNLRKMERDDKNFDFAHDLALLHGRILVSLGRVDDADRGLT
jgi:tetratricopeptide (TPR) repeat protein